MLMKHKDFLEKRQDLIHFELKAMLYMSWLAIVFALAILLILSYRDFKSIEHERDMYKSYYRACKIESDRLLSATCINCSTFNGIITSIEINTSSISDKHHYSY